MRDFSGAWTNKFQMIKFYKEVSEKFECSCGLIVNTAGRLVCKFVGL